ncbi:ketoacyl-ACP synthase III [bacterium]|nr:ketoacyl-ACP synthase III [bacterium]
MSKTIRSTIIGTGHGIPSRTISNDDLAKFVDTNDEWIRTRTGIETRKFVDLENGQSLTEIAIEGAEKALKKSGLKPEDIDFVLCATATPEAWMPIEAGRIKHALGLTNAAALDVNAACSGFMYTLHLADAMIRAGSQKNVLCVGGDVFQRILDWEDRGTCVLFGDGAGAAVVSATEADVDAGDSCIVGSRVYAALDSEHSLATKEIERDGKKVGVITMNGREVFKWASKCMAQSSADILKEYGVSPDEIKWFVPHQANIRIIEKVAEFLKFPMERTFVNVNEWGNTSAGTIPICLSEMNEKGLVEKGDLILVTTFGGGYTWGSMLIRW